MASDCVSNARAGATAGRVARTIVVISRTEAQGARVAMARWRKVTYTNTRAQTTTQHTHTHTHTHITHETHTTPPTYCFLYLPASTAHSYQHASATKKRSHSGESGPQRSQRYSGLTAFGWRRARMSGRRRGTSHARNKICGGDNAHASRQPAARFASHGVASSRTHARARARQALCAPVELRATGG